MADRYSDGPHGTTCSGCGQCCYVLQLPLTQDDARRDATMPERTRRWYLEDLTPIGWKTARARAPWLRPPSEALPVHQGQMLARYPSYYTCRHYDETTGLCGDHANRPDVCRGYPYYGQPELPAHMVLPPACEFRRDRGETPETGWEPVAFRPAAARD